MATTKAQELRMKEIKSKQLKLEETKKADRLGLSINSQRSSDASRLGRLAAPKQIVTKAEPAEARVPATKVVRSSTSLGASGLQSAQKLNLSRAGR